MGVRILHQSGDGMTRLEHACFYCSSTNWAFGPVFDSYEEAEGFSEWLKIDPRTLSEPELEGRYMQYLREAEEQVSCPTCKGTGVHPHWEEEFGFPSRCDTCSGEQTISKAKFSTGGYNE